MSGSHDAHHVEEQKPVAFTVPLILASVLVLIIILFLSLCDPNPHHHGDAAAHGGHHGAATEAATHDAMTPTEHPAHATTATEMKKDSLSVETTVPETAAEAHHAAGEHH